MYLNKEAVPVDITTISDRLKGQVSAIYIVDLQQSVISPAASNFDFHLEELADKDRQTTQELFSKAIPPSGFLADFLKWIDPTTDACQEFKYFSGLETLSIITGRKRCIPDWGQKTIYPNLYLVKLGLSTEARKSTTASASKRLIRKINKDLIFFDSFSPEAMWRSLAENPRRFITFDEFSKLLSEARTKTFMSGLKQDLTSLYDCPPEHRKKLSKEEFQVENPFIVFSGSTTLAWLLQELTEVDLRSGFLARFLLVPASEKEKIVPCPPKPDEAAERYLVNVLNEIYISDFLEMSLTPEAKGNYSAWYIRTEKELHREPNRELISPFFMRLTEEYALKFAILYAVSENPLVTEITVGHLQLAFALIEYLKACLRDLILRDFIFDQPTKMKLKILGLIQEKGSITHSILLRLSHMTARELREVIQTLTEEEQITVRTEGGRSYEALN